MPAKPRIETAITAAHRLRALASPVLGLVLAAASETAWLTGWLPCSALAAGAEPFPELLPVLLPSVLRELQLRLHRSLLRLHHKLCH